MEFLVGLHETIEAMICFKMGIPEEVVSQFDIDYEKNRGPYDYVEPGDSPVAPYHVAHEAASKLERMAAIILDVPWDLYETKIEELFRKEKTCAEN